MLWFVAFLVTIAAVMVGINRWKMANDPMYRVAEKNRKIWEKESGEELVYEWEPDDSNDFCTDPAYSGLLCNVFHHDDDDW